MSEEKEAEHSVPLLDEPLDLSLDTHGGEWEHYFESSLRERLGEAGMHNQWFGPPNNPTVYYEFHLTNPRIEAFLRLIPQEGGVRVLLVGPSEATIEESRDLWLAAVQTANERLGSDHSKFRWFAMVASEPVFSSGRQVLLSNATIGDMLIAPSGKAYWENKPHSAALDGTRLSWSSLVGVEGADTGYDFYSAQLKGARRLATLRAIMSVVFDSRWVIKLSPLDRKIPFPDHHPAAGPFDHPATLEGHAHTSVAFPDWIDDAWGRVMEQQDVLQALGMYQEGLEVWDGHPSLALVALVGVVEGVGARYQNLVRCECCDECRVQLGASKRFRAALKLVLSNREAKPLIDAYSPRSDTVHAGKLHGGELDPGAFESSLTQFDPISEFELGLVDELRAAAREILLLGLKGELPPP